MPETAQQTEAQNEATAPQPEIKIVETVNTVVDTTGYDAAIAAKEELMQYADEESLPHLRAEIEKLKTQRAESSASAERAELEEYRREKVNKQIADILPAGIDPSKIPGKDAAERLANAKAIAEAVTPLNQQLADMTSRMESGSPTAEQIAAHGEPMVPSGEINIGEQTAQAEKMMNEGDVSGLTRGPMMNKLKEWMKIQ